MDGEDNTKNITFYCSDQLSSMQCVYLLRVQGTGSFLRIKRPGRVVDHPPTSSTEVKERVHLYLYSPSGTSRPVIG
jgi:hypothetical protein